MFDCFQRPRQQHIIRIEPEQPLALCLGKSLIQRIALPRISLNIPIFTGGQRHNEIRQTRVQAAELSLQRENVERQLRISIRQNLSTMETAVKSHESALDALESAQKAFDIAAKSYEVGRSTLTDLDASRLALTQAQLAASQAVYSYLVAKAALESTVGADFTAENTTK